MDVDEFIERFVDGYLFEDLKSMAKIKLPEGKKYGAVGYPMVATIFAGMEMLGGLLMPPSETFDRNKGGDYFLNYWNEYFVAEYPHYRNLGKLLYELVRHGVAHTFIAKHGTITKFSGRTQSILVDKQKSEVDIDPALFAEEFEKSYEEKVKPLLDPSSTGPVNRKTFEKKVNEMAASYSKSSSDAFKSLPSLDSALEAAVRQHAEELRKHSIRASGASLAMGPITGTIETIRTDDKATTTSFSSSSVELSTNTTTVPLPTPSGTLPPTNEGQKRAGPADA